MRSTTTMRRLWEPACKRELVVVTLHTAVRLTVAAEMAEAVRALDAVMAFFGYHPRREDTGAFVCRPITGGTGYSLHAYGIAVDVNWRTNPYGARLITDMPRPMVEAIEAIRTKDGVRVWRWGGDWNDDERADDAPYDAMHFETQASPGELLVGIDWSTVRGTADPATAPAPVPPFTKGAEFVTLTLKLPVLALGDKGPAVTRLQESLNRLTSTSLRVDGGFGPATQAAVENLQRFFHLQVDGIVGERTWGALALCAFPVAA